MTDVATRRTSPAHDRVDAFPGLDVVVCVHDAARAPLILECAEAVLAELADGDRLIVVSDHSPELADLLVRRLGARATVLANDGPRGLSAARDAGVAAGTNPVVCFIDDDAVARPGWARAVREAFADAAGDAGAPGHVVAIGGAVHPRHIDGRGLPQAPPPWLPAEHGWILGCDYLGLPGDGSEIRNPIGAAMAIRRDALEAAGGFDGTLGRVGSNSAGGEETEMLMRIRASSPGARVLRATGFAVDHAVPPSRRSLRYHLKRAFGEGRSKARLASALHGDVSSESGHLAATVPRAIGSGIAAPARGDVTGPLRAAVSAAVVAAAGLGFLTGRTGAALPGANPLENRAAAVGAPGSAVAGADVSGEISPERAAPDVGNPDVSVVLCTDGRGPHLAEAILAVLDDGNGSPATALELVVVDNSTDGDLHARARISDIAAGDARMRIVRAPVRGLSRARNVGIAAARGGIIAFTDDDTIVDPGWAAEIAAGFRDGDGRDDPSIWCVTGRTTAHDLDTDVHRWFEEAISFDKGPIPMLWDERGGTAQPLSGGAEPSSGTLIRPPLYPWPAGCFGSGNNMAFRSSAFRRVGGFAEELGAGRVTRGGEDLDMFRLIILAGGKIAYRPSAAARHHHRDSLAALRGQMFGYGAGMAAALARCAWDDPRHAARIIRGIPEGLRMLVDMRTGADRSPSELTPAEHTPAEQTPAELNPADRTPEHVGYPASLLRTELRGYLLGAPLLLAARAADAAGAFGIGASGSPTNNQEVRR